MKLNWLLRFKNKTTLIAIIAAVLLLLEELGIKIPHNIEEIVNTILTILVLLGIIVDPTTAGLSDSDRAMKYTTPNATIDLSKLTKLRGEQDDNSK